MMVNMQNTARAQMVPMTWMNVECILVPSSIVSRVYTP